MMRNKNTGVGLGIIFLLITVFFWFSGYIVPGRDPDIGAFQLAAILMCGAASLCAFDFAFLLPRQLSLRKRDWIISTFLVSAGVMVFNINNIAKELGPAEHIFKSVLVFVNYIGILLVTGGLCWRFQYQLDKMAGNIVVNVKKFFVVQLIQKHITGLLFMASALFLLVGTIVAYGETPSVEVIANPFRLLFIYLLFFLAGRGVLKFFLDNLQTPAMQMLSPLAGMTLWALVLGIGVGLRIPVWQISIPLWGLTIFLAWRGFDWGEFRAILPWIGITLFLTLLATFPYVLNGFSVYMGSHLPDGWSYVSFGQYLWRYKRGIDSGLQPIYQYASHLSPGRYLGSSLLGFLSPITGKAGDTHSASGFYFPVVMFVYSSSIIGFSLYKFNKLTLRLIFMVLVLLSGWSYTVITANNLDQALVLAFLPGMALLMESPRFDRLRWIIWIASILAVCTYIYPEMAILIAFTIVLYSFEQITRQRLSLKYWFWGGLGILMLTIILLSPFLSDLYPFFRAQFGIAGRANRPGGNLTWELLSTKYGFIALWGLGAELSPTPAEPFWYTVRSSMAYFLGIFLLMGAILQLRERKLGTFVITIFFTGVIHYYLNVQSYPYAAYKVISIYWWLVVVLIVEGIGFVLSTRRDLIKFIFQSFLLAVMIGFSTVFVIRSNLFFSSLEYKWSIPFRQLETLHLLDNEPLIASIWEWFPNQWAMYYLRERPSLVYPYRSYANQSHVILFMEQAAPVDYENVRSVLTDRENPFQPSRQILWQNGIYTLWKLPAEWAYVAEVIDPDGKVQADQPNTLWLAENTNLVIIASRTGKFNFTFDVALNPIGRSGTYVFVVTPSGTEFSHRFIDGNQTITLSLKEGRNQVDIQHLISPSNSGNAETNSSVMLGNLEITYQP